MESLSVYFEMVDAIIKDLGVDPALCRGEKEGQWSLKRGSADVWIDIWKNADNYAYFQAMAPVCEIPANNAQAFYAEVLEINHNLYGVGMTKFENWIYIKVLREVEGLDKSEMLAMFNRIGYYADEYDDKLRNKYFGGGGGRPV